MEVHLGVWVSFSEYVLHYAVSEDSGYCCMKDSLFAWHLSCSLTVRSLRTVQWPDRHLFLLSEISPLLSYLITNKLKQNTWTKLFRDVISQECTSWPRSSSSHIFSKFFQYYKTLSLQIDRGLWAKSKGYGESGCVRPEVQLLPLWGGSEEPKQQDAVWRSPRPGHHAGSRQHH